MQGKLQDSRSHQDSLKDENIKLITSLETLTMKLMQIESEKLQS
jgi:hypothetical protein